MEIMDLDKQVVSRVVCGDEFYKFAKDHMKLIIEEMDNMHQFAITKINDVEHNQNDSKSQCYSITRSFSKNISLAGEITILPPLHAKTKERGKSGRPNDGSVPKIQLDREKRSKGRQCKRCGKHKTNHNSKNCKTRTKICTIQIFSEYVCMYVCMYICMH